MQPKSIAVAGLMTAVVAAGWTGVAAQEGQAPAGLPMSQTVRATGQSVTGAYEGWFRNPDGTFTLLAGYFNRNEKQELTVPVGPNNRIEPGGPDLGQPTHFGPGRQFGIFAITVPKDFGSKKLTWTLVANGQTNVITMHLDPNWVVEPLLDAGSKNTPPKLRFDPSGPAVTGPPRGFPASLTTTVSEPLPLVVWASDEGPQRNVAAREAATRGAGRGGAASSDTFPPQQLSVSWSKFRGPGPVAFQIARPPIARADGKAVTTATFTVPGEYVLRVQANDASGDGGGGFQCCWTNAHVRVTVTPSSTH